MLVAVKIVLIYSDHILVINVLHFDRVVHVHLASIHGVLLGRMP